jgi:branched-chain amino acid transport system permease protein
MNLEFFIVSLFNGISYGLLLFMLSSGLTLIFSLMGVLNFAQASFYMLGAYLGYTLSHTVGYWVALWAAPLLLGLMGAGFEKYALRKVRAFGHVPELLITFGLSYVVLELVQLIWGRSAVNYQIPPELQGALLTLFGIQFSAYRAVMMLASVLILLFAWLLLARTRVGLVVQAAIAHPDMLQALGHNVPRVMMWVFGGGAALAGLAGVMGGNAFVTDPGIAATVGSIIFVVVVVGGLGSLLGAFIASLLIGLLQTFAVAVDVSLLTVFQSIGWSVSANTPGHAIWAIKISQWAVALPYLLLIAVLIVRPRGLLGTREV